MVDQRKKEMPVEIDRRGETQDDRNSNSENIVRLKLWAIILVIGGCLGWLFTTSVLSSERLTKVETTQKHVVEALMEIKGAMNVIKTDITDDMKDIKSDLREHMRATSTNKSREVYIPK
jgi:hypothetical protein